MVISSASSTIASEALTDRGLPTGVQGDGIGRATTENGSSSGCGSTGFGFGLAVSNPSGTRQRLPAARWNHLVIVVGATLRPCDSANVRAMARQLWRLNRNERISST